ncbi:MAG: flagellar motor protein MotB [Candidatus Riflemargulisbacteria bacterium]
MSKKKHAEDGGHGGGNIGTVMMADLFCQLMIFFLLLYTFAIVNTSKNTPDSVVDNPLQEAMKGFKKRVDPEVKEPPKDPVVTVAEAKVEELEVENKSQLITKIKDIVEKETLKKYIEVVVEEQKIRLIFNQPVLFNSGFAYLKPGANSYLDPIINGILKTMANDIIIEGHTDDLPIKNDMYKDNWQLSFDRAYNVLKYMVDVGKIEPTRVSAIGYGEYRPRVANDTEANRSINRRIEVNIMIQEKKINPPTKASEGETKKADPHKKTSKGH